MLTSTETHYWPQRKRQNTNTIKRHKFTLTVTAPSLQNETANAVVPQHSRILLKKGINPEEGH